jgi:hypothetical protein
MKNYTPAPWSKDGLWTLLRFGRKDDGSWMDEVKDGEYLPSEEDAALIASLPRLLEENKHLRETLEAYMMKFGNCGRVYEQAKRALGEK